MEVSIWLKHKKPEQDALARDVEEFLARGGKIEVLENGARSTDRRTAKQVHEQNVRAKMAKNDNLFKKAGKGAGADAPADDEGEDA